MNWSLIGCNGDELMEVLVLVSQQEPTFVNCVNMCWYWIRVYFNNCELLLNGNRYLDWRWNYLNDNNHKSLYDSIKYHCVKSVEIRSFFWSIFSCIQSKYRKIRTRKKLRIWTLFTQCIQHTLKNKRYCAIISLSVFSKFQKHYNLSEGTIKSCFIFRKTLSIILSQIQAFGLLF